jgi:hypothetical protein
MGKIDWDVGTGFARLLGAATLLGCLTILGCKVADEPYPHPFIPHKTASLVKEQALPSPEPVLGSAPVRVCDFQNQAGSPVGACVVDRTIMALLLEPADGAFVADAFCKQMESVGVRCTRLPGETGDAALLTEEQRAGNQLLLKATILNEEFSQHVANGEPYDLYYVTARFSLDSLPEGGAVWTGDAAARVKLRPCPSRRQPQYEKLGAEMLATSLLSDRSFVAAIQAKREE